MSLEQAWYQQGGFRGLHDTSALAGTQSSTFAGSEGKEYSACPVIRYFAPYYYAIYLHAAIPDHNGWVSFLARSKDLIAWELSPMKPILEPQLARAANSLAWALLTDPDPVIRNPSQALPLAQRAVKLAPQEGNYWNTLGVAYCRNGDDEESIVALTRTIELRDGGDGLDWFVLTMAHARRGEEGLAREWYERAQTWCRAQDPLADELQRTQAEASRAIEKLDL